MVGLDSIVNGSEGSFALAAPQTSRVNQNKKDAAEDASKEKKEEIGMWRVELRNAVFTCGLNESGWP